MGLKLLLATSDKMWKKPLNASLRGKAQLPFIEWILPCGSWWLSLSMTAPQDMSVALLHSVSMHEMPQRYMQPEMSSESVAADFEKEAEARTWNCRCGTLLTPNSSPPKNGAETQKETRKSSNHPFFRGKLLVFGGVLFLISGSLIFDFPS